MKKILITILITILVFAGILAAFPALAAGTLTNVYDSPGSSYSGDTSTHVVEFTTSTFGNGTEKGIPLDGKIVIDFGDFDISAVGAGDVLPYDSSIDWSFNVNVAGSMLTLTRTSGTVVSENKFVRIKISDVTNPAAGNYTISVTTKNALDAIIDGPGTSANISIVDPSGPNPDPNIEGVGVVTNVIPTIILNTAPTGENFIMPVNGDQGTTKWSDFSIVIKSNAVYSIKIELSDHLKSGANTIFTDDPDPDPCPPAPVTEGLQNFTWKLSGGSYALFSKVGGIGTADTVVSGAGPTSNLGAGYTVRVKCYIPLDAADGDYSTNIIFTAIANI